MNSASDSNRPSGSLPPAGSMENALPDILKEIGIPPRPAILERITKEIRSEDPRFHLLSREIEADVGLTASLLKLVNSPFYGFDQRVRTVHHAVVVLGLQAIATTVAGIVLRKMLPMPRRLERFWDASAQIAQLSGWLTTEIGTAEWRLNAHEAYTFSLFRDCGIPIMLRRFPDYLETLGLANAESDRTFTEIEDAHYPTNHAVVGSILGQSWWLSEETCHAIRHHHDFVSFRAGAGALTRASRHMVAIAQVAERIVQETSGLSQNQEWPKMGPACLRILGLTESDLEHLLPEARKWMSEQESL
jgi:HD-like signal output (HDOD) protein